MAKDIRGTEIKVGSHVSDGLAAGRVTAVHDEQIWFTCDYGDQARGQRLFNRPENLMVISEQRWKHVVG